ARRQRPVRVQSAEPRPLDCGAGCADSRRRARDRYRRGLGALPRGVFPLRLQDAGLQGPFRCAAAPRRLCRGRFRLRRKRDSRGARKLRRGALHGGAGASSRAIAVVREIARILAPGGRLILTAPLGSGIHQEPYHFYGGYTPYWYRRFLDAAGFDDVEVVANEGSFRHFAQEAIRFCRMTRPFALGMPLVAELAWLPFWCLLAPVLVVAVPVAAKVLDRFDREQRFTVGYHVRAVKRLSAGRGA